MEMSEPSLELLQRMIQKVLENQQRHSDSLSDITNRMTSLEVKVATLHGDFANQSIRIDRIETRLERIERRLDLVEA
jgi:chromosome segregation ATPase